MAECFPTPAGGGPRGVAVVAPVRPGEHDLCPHGPDAALIALCRRYLGLEAVLERLHRVECQAEEQADALSQKRAEQRRQRLLPRRAHLARRFAITPATAVHGLRAKLRVHLFRSQHSDGTPVADRRDLHALCQEVLRLTEGGAWAGSALPTPG